MYVANAHRQLCVFFFFYFVRSFFFPFSNLQKFVRFRSILPFFNAPFVHPVLTKRIRNMLFAIFLKRRLYLPERSFRTFPTNNLLFMNCVHLVVGSLLCGWHNKWARRSCTPRFDATSKMYLASTICLCICECCAVLCVQMKPTKAHEAMTMKMNMSFVRRILLIASEWMGRTKNLFQSLLRPVPTTPPHPFLKWASKYKKQFNQDVKKQTFPIYFISFIFVFFPFFSSICLYGFGIVVVCTLKWTIEAE